MNYAGQISQLKTDLSAKISKLSGSIVDPDSVTHTTVAVNSIGYDATNKQLILKTGGADTVIPFSGGDGIIKSFFVCQINPRNTSPWVGHNQYIIKNEDNSIYFGNANDTETNTTDFVTNSDIIGDYYYYSGSNDIRGIYLAKSGYYLASWNRTFRNQARSGTMATASGTPLYLEKNWYMELTMPYVDFLIYFGTANPFA